MLLLLGWLYCFEQSCWIQAKAHLVRYLVPRNGPPAVCGSPPQETKAGPSPSVAPLHQVFRRRLLLVLAVPVIDLQAALKLTYSPIARGRVTWHRGP